MTRTTISQPDLARKPQEVVDKVQHGSVVVVESLGREQVILLERMQTPATRKGMETAFHATPAALGRAAVKAARRRR